jgi:mutator protein MutT
MSKDIVKIVFINKFHEFLLQQHSEEQQYPGQWSFFGGKIEAGETPEQAIVREIDEELSYELSFFTTLKETQDRTWFMGYMEKELDQLILAEGADFGFFTYEEAMNLPLTESTKAVLQQYYGPVLEEKSMLSYVRDFARPYTQETA